MTVTLPIPDDLAARLGGAASISRRALEVFALAEYGAGRLSQVELKRLLGFGAAAFDRFLVAHGIVNETAALQGKSQAHSLPDRIQAFRRGKILQGLDSRALIREGRR